MQAVSEGSTEKAVAFGGKGCGNDCGVRGIGCRIGHGDRSGHHLARVRCGHFKVGDQKDKAQSVRDGITQRSLKGTGNGEAAVKRRGCIVGMPFQFSTEAEDAVAGERPSRELIESHQYSKTDGDAAAESACLGNASLDPP